MFNIKLVDIAGDGLVIDCQTKVETLVEAELQVAQAINEHLHITNVRLMHVDELAYTVWVNGREIGMVVFRSL